MGLEDLKKSFDGAITAAANAASDATSIAKKGYVKQVVGNW